MTAALAPRLLSTLLLLTGLVFWFAGTWPLLGRGSYLRKLHYLGIADTLGSALMLVGLLLRFNPEWPLLLLALLSLVVWNTIFGYVLASCSQSPDPRSCVGVAGDGGADRDRRGQEKQG